MNPVQFFREKLRASIEGREYTPPSPSAVGPPVPSSTVRAGSAVPHKPSAPRRKDDDWGDWGGDESGADGSVGPALRGRRGALYGDKQGRALYESRVQALSLLVVECRK